MAPDRVGGTAPVDDDADDDMFMGDGGAAVVGEAPLAPSPTLLALWGSRDLFTTDDELLVRARDELTSAIENLERLREQVEATRDVLPSGLEAILAEVVPLTLKLGEEWVFEIETVDDCWVVDIYPPSGRYCSASRPGTD